MPTLGLKACQPFATLRLMGLLGLRHGCRILDIDSLLQRSADRSSMRRNANSLFTKAALREKRKSVRWLGAGSLRKGRGGR